MQRSHTTDCSAVQRVGCLFYGNSFDTAASSFSCSGHECTCVPRAGCIGFRTDHPKYAQIVWQNHSELGNMSSQLASVVEWAETTEGWGFMLTSLMVRWDHQSFSCLCGESGAEKCQSFYFSCHEMEPVGLVSCTFQGDCIHIYFTRREIITRQGKRRRKGLTSFSWGTLDVRSEIRPLQSMSVPTFPHAYFCFERLVILGWDHLPHVCVGPGERSPGSLTASPQK